MPHRSQEPVDVGRLLDQGNWGTYQKWLVGLTALTLIFDGIDNQLLGVAIPSIMQEWSAPRAAFAPVISVGLFRHDGRRCGGRVSRRSLRPTPGPRWLWSMALFGVMTAAGAAATSPIPT